MLDKQIGGYYHDKDSGQDLISILRLCEIHRSSSRRRNPTYLHGPRDSRHHAQVEMTSASEDEQVDIGGILRICGQESS